MIIKYSKDFATITEETISTIGFFDGVHRGHRYLLDQLKARGKQEGLKTSVVTFAVHPRFILKTDYLPQLLNTFDERLSALAGTGIDYCYVLDFTHGLSQRKAADFMCAVLRKQLNIDALLIGYDHHFGKDRISSYEDYATYGKQCGIKVYRANKEDFGNLSISSTMIRNLLSEGKVREASRLLSYPYHIHGKVIEGDRIGRSLNVPTANIEPDSKEKMVPGNGVYAVYVQVCRQCLPGMAYIGYRPTVSFLGEKRIEVHLFGFDQCIYGKELTIEFIDFVRPDRQFPSLEELKAQLLEDKKEVIAILDRN